MDNNFRSKTLNANLLYTLTTTIFDESVSFWNL